MAKYAPKHLEVSGGAEPHRAFAGHKTARLAVTAATTIAMTGSSLLAPFSAFANDLSDTTAQDAIMSPLAAHAGEAAGSAVKTNTQKIADLQAAIDAAKAAEAEAKSDYGGCPLYRKADGPRQRPDCLRRFRLRQFAGRSRRACRIRPSTR